MEGQPPLLGLAEQQEARELNLDDEFAAILYAMMRDEISAATAIQAFERYSVAAMEQYRDASSSLLHRAARYLHTRRLACELEEQAASWQLLQALYCSGDSPAGSDIAGAADVGGRKTLWQQTADLVNNQDRNLRRCAQVLWWLEALAAQKLSDAPPSRFAHHEGIWRETLLTSGSSSSSRMQQQPAGGSSSSSRDAASAPAVSVELDPDAPSRAKVSLALGDRQGEERLAAQLWQLIRAGKVKEARLLCVEAGQAWRCLSLAGGGPWGPLPVGAAAAEATEATDAQDAADDLAWQVEGGLAAARLAWKWACYAAAEAAANATPGNRWEAAVYGAMCGHVQRMLPVCGSWEDEAWVYCRAWLDLATDALLLEGAEEQQQAAAGGAEEGLNSLELMMIGGSGAEDVVSGDLLAGCVDMAASSGYSRSTDSSLLREGLAAMAGGWPLHKLLSDAGSACVPRDFSELLQLLSHSGNPTVRMASRQQQHILQLLVMSEDWSNLGMELSATALAAAEQLQQQQEQQQQQQQQQGGGGAVDADTAMEDAAGAGAAGGGGGGGGLLEDEGVRASDELASGVLRFAAHWALGLRALGLLLHSGWLPDDNEEAEEVVRLEKLLSKVVYQYGLQLAAQPESLRLVPIYLCHVQELERQLLLNVLINKATDTLDDASCQALYLQLVETSDAWYERQQRLNADVAAGRAPGPWWDVQEEQEEEEEQHKGDDLALLALRRPSSCLFGDLRENEAQLLVKQLVFRGCLTASVSPLQRCRQLRWLFYSFTGALAQLQQQHHAVAAAAAADLATGAEEAAALPAPAALGWQYIWQDALEGALSLAAELALNPGFGSAGLQTLLAEVVPANFVQAVSQVAEEQLQDAAQQLQVQRQLLVLAFWQRYVELDEQYHQWGAEWSELLARGDAGGLAALAGAGQQLVSEMLQLALQDQLSLPAPARLVQLLEQQQQQQQQQQGQQDRSSGVQLTEGELLAVPEHDAADETPARLILALTVARRVAGDSTGPAAGDGSNPDLPYIQLEAREQQHLQQQLSDYLHSVLIQRDVSFKVLVVDPSQDLAGCVLVCMEATGGPGGALPDPAGAEVDRLRLQRRAQKAWQDMVAVATQLLCGSGRPAAGGSSSSGGGSAAAAGGSAGASSTLEGLPRLSVVQISSSVSTRLALCRRRTTSKLLRRSAKVLLELAKTGHPSSLLDVLIGAAGDVAGREGPQLLELLSPRDAGQLLVAVEQIMEEGGLLEEELA